MESQTERSSLNKSILFAMAGLFCIALIFSADASHDGSNDFEINVGLSGTWFTPEFPGQGFLIDVISSRGDLFVTWFTFRALDDMTPGTLLRADEQRWYVAEGTFQGHTGVLQLFSTTGGRFNTGDPVSLNEEGTLTVNFTHCTEAIVEVLFSGSDTPIQIPIQRLTPDINCIRQNPAR